MKMVFFWYRDTASHDLKLSECYNNCIIRKFIFVEDVSYLILNPKYYFMNSWLRHNLNRIMRVKHMNEFQITFYKNMYMCRCVSCFQITWCSFYTIFIFYANEEDEEDKKSIFDKIIIRVKNFCVPTCINTIVCMIFLFSVYINKYICVPVDL